MNLEKAIEVLQDIKDTGIDAGHYDAEDAIELGIKAMERLQYLRGYSMSQVDTRLPGETKD